MIDGKPAIAACVASVPMRQTCGCEPSSSHSRTSRWSLRNDERVAVGRHVVHVAVADRVDVDEEGVARIDLVAVLPAAMRACPSASPSLAAGNTSQVSMPSRRALLQASPDLEQRGDTGRVGRCSRRDVRDRGVDEQHHVGQQHGREHELDDGRAGRSRRSRGGRAPPRAPAITVQKKMSSGPASEASSRRRPAPRRAGAAPPDPQQTAARRVVVARSGSPARRSPARGCAEVTLRVRRRGIRKRAM